MSSPERRIDDRIRILCSKLAAPPNGDFENLLQELLELIHEKVERLRTSAARLLLKGEPLESQQQKTDVLKAITETNEGSEC